MMTKDAKSSRLNNPDVSYVEARWWESAEDHKFALEVLQLPLRRNILRFMGLIARSREEIEKEFGLNADQATYHLAMLEKALC